MDFVKLTSYDALNGTLIASDLDENDQVWRQTSRNTCLYRTPMGGFFVHCVTRHHEKDTYTGLVPGEARKVYDSLPTHYEPFE